MIHPVPVYVAKVTTEKTAARQVVESYAPARKTYASVYPVDNTAYVNEYGLAPGEMLRLIMAPGERVDLRDGMWIYERYEQGDKRPPWRIKSVMRWPRHTEITLEKVVHLDG